jgi:beta-glucanase (GH16 family)
MLKIKIALVMVIVSFCLTNAQTSTIFSEDFNATVMDPLVWHIPTWVSSTDGTYMGRTQMRCTQNAALPDIVNGEAIIKLETYNPTGFSFYGTDVISNTSFTMGEGLVFTIRAKISQPLQGGIVGGIFLYDLTSGTNHDEIDFELLTNRPQEVQTNIYSNEPLGAGSPAFETLTGLISDYHIYSMKWTPDEVTWLVDDAVVRKMTSSIPAGPMHLHLNIWAPAAEWAAAYNSNLQPVSSAGLNQTYSMVVDYVKVESLITSSFSGVQDKEFKVIFYPSPASDMIYFNNSKDLNVSIFNINGNLVLNRKPITDGSLNISRLSPGFYILRCEQKGAITNSALLIE